MDIDTSRAKAIQAWKTDHPEEKTDERARVQLNGKDVPLEVWRIPIKLLIFNIRNGRFASELIAKEKELKRKLDPTNKNDEKIIKQLLLDQKKSESDALKEDISKHGQMEYGIITFDGAVINANRRMAVISSLFDETRDSKFEYLRVAILPKNVDAKDLWRIEAGIQFGKDFLLSYGPVNELLKIKEGKNQGLKEKDIEATLLGRYSEKEIKEKLQILKQIDSYLVFINKPDQYDVVKDNVEKFISLQRNVVLSLKRSGVSDNEIHKINLIAFLLIESSLKGTKNNISHWDIRKLKKIAQYGEAKKELMSNYNLENPEKTNLKQLLESFRTAEEILENKENKDKPLKLLRKAWDAIRIIDRSGIKDGEAKQLLNQIEAQAKRLKSKKGE